MFTKLKLNFAGAFLRNLVGTIATDKDTQTTFIGIVAGAIVAIPGLDFGALLGGDLHQVAKLASGVATFAVGYLATKENRDGHTTLIGGVAAACQAYVGNLAGAAAVGLVGYLTNKPVAAALPPVAPAPIQKG